MILHYCSSSQPKFYGTIMKLVLSGSGLLGGWNEIAHVYKVENAVQILVLLFDSWSSMSIFFFGNFMGFSYLLFIVISSDPYYKKVEYKQLNYCCITVYTVGYKNVWLYRIWIKRNKRPFADGSLAFGAFFFAARTYVIQALVYHFRLAEGWYDKRASVGPHASHWPLGLRVLVHPIIIATLNGPLPSQCIRKG